MLKFFTLGLLLLFTFSLYGQDLSDTIEIKKANGIVFQQHGKRLTLPKLLEISSSNPESYKEMKIAKGKYDAASAFGFAGGFLIGWPLGAAIAGGKPNWELAAIGAGLIGIAIPFSKASINHARKSVEIYNNGLKQSVLNADDFKLGLTCNGVGLKINF